MFVSLSPAHGDVRGGYGTLKYATFESPIPCSKGGPNGGESALSSCVCAACAHCARNSAAQCTEERAPPLHYEALLLTPPTASPATVDRRRTGHREEEMFKKNFSGALSSLLVKL